MILNPLSTNPTKCSNTLTIHPQEPTNCLSVSDHFVGLAFKGLIEPTARQVSKSFDRINSFPPNVAF